LAKIPIRPFAAVAAGLVVIILVFAHTRGLNGPDYWRWEWRSRPDLWRAAFFLLLAASPALLAQVFGARKSVALALLCAATVALQLTSNAVEPRLRGVERFRRVASDQLTTSYYTVAESIVRAERAGRPVDWLRQYDDLLRLAPQHATTKPPGPVAFYVAVIRLFGPERAPIAAAVLLALLSAAGIAVTYSAARIITGDEAALQAATLMALAPSMTVFFLYLDTVYPILSCALLAAWFMALKRGHSSEAIAFGLILFAATMTSYTLLVLGIALGGMTLVWLRRGGRLRTAATLTAIAIGTFLGAYAVLWLSTGFNPISALRTALEMQYRYLPLLHRPWPRTIPFDILDFCLGAGWVPVVLVLTSFCGAPPPAAASAGEGAGAPHGRAILLWGLATPLTVALTGLIQAETARVWIFMLPLLMMPAGVELSRWPLRQRFAVHVVMIAVTFALYANMTFIGTS